MERFDQSSLAPTSDLKIAVESMNTQCEIATSSEVFILSIGPMTLGLSDSNSEVFVILTKLSLRFAV